MIGPGLVCMGVMNTAVRKALRSHRACFSFKGHDFCCCGDRRHVKKTTNRARRNLDKALTHDRGEN